MEKDCFKDRTKETTMFDKIKPNMYVFICEKKAQKYASTMEDLTCVKITEVLTKHDHPRGIKVKGLVLKKEKEGYLITDKIATGRVVYMGRSK